MPDLSHDEHGHIEPGHGEHELGEPGHGEHEHSAAFHRGLAVRKQVLGADHVERSLSKTSGFSQPVQKLVTEHCWGDVWAREGLDRRTRSLVNLAMLTAMNRMHEFAVHVRGAVRNGCTEQEIQETLLQTAVYCGAPAALESFRVAESVLAELASSGELAAAQQGGL